MASGFKLRLEEAKAKKAFLKLIFQYPASSKAIVKRGYVLECYEDSFDFDEKFDGEATYSYEFLAEIVEEKL